MPSPKHRIKVRLADDSDKLLRFDGNALAEIEELLDCRLLQLMHDVGTSGEEGLLACFGFREIRALLYAGLRGAGGKFNIEQVGGLMHTDMVALRGYIEAIFCALTVAMRGKLPEEIAEEAEAEKEAEKEAKSEEGDAPKPNPT